MRNFSKILTLGDWEFLEKTKLTHVSYIFTIKNLSKFDFRRLFSFEVGSVHFEGKSVQNFLTIFQLSSVISALSGWESQHIPSSNIGLILSKS